MRRPFWHRRAPAAPAGDAITSDSWDGELVGVPVGASLMWEDSFASRTTETQWSDLGPYDCGAPAAAWIVGPYNVWDASSACWKQIESATSGAYGAMGVALPNPEYRVRDVYVAARFWAHLASDAAYSREFVVGHGYRTNRGYELGYQAMLTNTALRISRRGSSSPIAPVSLATLPASEVNELVPFVLGLEKRVNIEAGTVDLKLRVNGNVLLHVVDTPPEVEYLNNDATPQWRMLHHYKPDNGALFCSRVGAWEL